MAAIVSGASACGVAVAAGTVEAGLGGTVDEVSVPPVMGEGAVMEDTGAVVGAG